MKHRCIANVPEQNRDLDATSKIMRSDITHSAPIRLFALVFTLGHLVRAADPLVLSLSKKVPAQCDTVTLSWTGGTPNYTIVITSQAAPVFNPPVFTALGLSNNSITWTANLCGGAPVAIVASDSGGYKYTISFTLKLSTNTSCLTDAQQNSSQCLLESVSFHAPSATSTPSGASQEHRPSSHMPVIIALVVVGIVIIASALGWRAYRSRRRRHQNFGQGE